MENDLLNLEAQWVHVGAKARLDQLLGALAVGRAPVEALLQEALRGIQRLQIASDARVVE